MKLYTCQQELVDRLGSPALTSRLIGDEMGIGKTVEALAIDIGLRKRLAGHRQTLIIAPRQTHEDPWKSTIEAYTDKEACIIDRKNRAPFITAAKNAQYEYFVCHYEAMRLMPELAQIMWAHVILDECVPQDTEILTREGWKTYDQLTIGEEVLGYDSNEMVWTKLLAVNLPGVRETGTLSVKGFSVRTTSEHQWIMRNKAHGAERKVTSSGHKPRGDHQEIVLAAPFAGGHLPVTPEEASIIAWILGDGGIYPLKKTGTGKPTSYSAFIFQTKPDCCERIDKLLSSIEHTKSPVRQGGFGSSRQAYRWRISIQYIRDLYNRAGLDYKNPKDNLIRFVLGLSSDARASFCHDFELAEGNNSSRQYKKVDGIFSPPQRGVCQNPGPVQDALRLSFFLEGFYPSVIKQTNMFSITRPAKRADSFEWVTDGNQEKVWCPTTETGNWVMRQGSLIAITGNCHRIKNRKAQQTLAVKRLQTLYKTAMSGTPADDKPQDLWSTLNFLYPKQFSSYWRFVQQFCVLETGTTPGGHRTYEKIVGAREDTVGTLLKQIEPFYVRRLKEDVLKDLPSKYYSRIRVDLLPGQRKVYDSLRSDMLAWIGENEDQPLSVPQVVSQLVRLQQAALASLEWAPVRAGSQDTKVTLKEPSAKLDALVELLQDERPLPAVIFSQSKSMVYLVVSRLRKEGLRVVEFTGDTPDVARHRSVKDFQSGAADAFVGTIAAGGEGITLTRSSTVIFLDRSWTPAKNLQAEDRLHRIGQKNAVQVVDFFARDTVDSDVRDANIRKWSQLRAILGDTRVRRS
jgi:hypothetical protein